MFCCTGTKGAESWSCACGVKCTLKANRSYNKLYKDAIRDVKGSMKMVIQNIFVHKIAIIDAASCGREEEACTS